MNEATKPTVKLSPQQLAIMAELTRRGIPFTPPKVSWDDACKAMDELAASGYDFDVLADREAQLQYELEVEAQRAEAACDPR
jgi:hypothetical protein